MSYKQVKAMLEDPKVFKERFGEVSDKQIDRLVKDFPNDSTVKQGHFLRHLHDDEEPS